MIVVVAEKAMVEIFGAWNKSNPGLSSVLNWSLAARPCYWTGVTCYSDLDPTVVTEIS